MNKNSLPISTLISAIEKEIQHRNPMFSQVFLELFRADLMSNEEHSNFLSVARTLKDDEYWENNFMVMIQVLEFIETDLPTI